MKNKSTKIESFVNKIKSIYPEYAEGIVAVLTKEKEFSTFRIVSEDAASVLKSLTDEGFEVISDESGVFYYAKNATKRLSESEVYQNAQIYIQNPSSMLPVIELDPIANELILDIAAAPGSKTIQLYNYSNGEAEIYAVEKDKNRFFKLRDNCKKYSAKITEFILADGFKLKEQRPEFLEYFDKILVDAPCSSEGTFSLKDESDLKFWNPKKYKSFIGPQKRLISSAFEMLKPGGTMVYSTCTYSIEENEAIVNWLLKNNENAKVIEFNEINKLKIANSTKGFIEGKGKEFDESLQHTIRVLPNGIWEGFFVAKIQKTIS